MIGMKTAKHARTMVRMALTPKRIMEMDAACGAIAMTAEQRMKRATCEAFGAGVPAGRRRHEAARCRKEPGCGAIVGGHTIEKSCITSSKTATDDSSCVWC